MSYSGPHYATCCLCNGDATDWRTVKIGEHEAHQRCAEQTDVYDLVSCAYCNALTMADDAGDWVKCPDGRMCPQCREETEPVASLAGLMREVSS